MTDQSEPLRFALRDFRPATFAERGAHVPFTSPILAQARVRVSPRGVREVVIRNPAGGDGWYVGQWHGMIDGARLSVHDRLLYRRIEAAGAVQPLALRRVAREVALEGYAGRPARAAAEAAIAGEARALAECRAALLAASGTPDDETAILRPRPGAGAGPIESRLDALAECLAPVGLAADAAAPLARDLAGLHALVRSLETAADADGDLDPALREATLRAAGTTIRLAAEARTAALAGTEDPIALLAAPPASLDRRRADIVRLAWVLDGWPALLALWTAAAARGPQQLGRALAEIAASLPPLPLEVEGSSPAPRAGVVPGSFQQRRVRVGHDWLTGIAERDLIARNEALLAGAL